MRRLLFVMLTSFAMPARAESLPRLSSARYKVDGFDLTNIPYLAEQRVFVRNLDTKHANDVLQGMDDEADS